MNYNSDMYPVQFDVEYPESRNRLTALVRLILAIPIIIIAALVAPNASDATSQLPNELATDPNCRLCEEVAQGIQILRIGEMVEGIYIGAGLYIAIALMILFRKKYPRWWFDWNLELSRFSARIGAYIFLLRDEYPSTDEQQAVTLDIAYPDAEQLNRVMPLIKWLLAIPHYIILALLGILVFFVTIIAWFAILIIGRYPQGLFNFTVGYARWANRVWAYSALMVTDRYPPFRFGP